MPPLTVTVMRKGRVCILAVGGELDVATAPTLTRHAAAALRQPTERLIIDLSGLTFIDCSGVRALAAATRAESRALVAEARQVRARRAAIREDIGLTAGARTAHRAPATKAISVGPS